MDQHEANGNDCGHAKAVCGLRGWKQSTIVMLAMALGLVAGVAEAFGWRDIGQGLSMVGMKIGTILVLAGVTSVPFSLPMVAAGLGGTLYYAALFAALSPASESTPAQTAGTGVVLVSASHAADQLDRPNTWAAWQVNHGSEPACEVGGPVATDAWIDPNEKVDSLIVTQRGSSRREAPTMDFETLNLDAGGDSTKSMFEPEPNPATILGAQRVRLRGAPIDGAKAQEIVQRMIENDRRGAHRSKCQYAEISINHVLRSAATPTTADADSPSHALDQTGMLPGQHLWDLANTLGTHIEAGRQEAADAGGSVDADAREHRFEITAHYEVPQDTPKLDENALWSRLLRAVQQQRPGTELVMRDSDVPGMRNLLADAQR